MDKNNCCSGKMGALRSTRLMENRRRQCDNDRSCDGDDLFYRPEWLNGQDFALLAAFCEVCADEGEAICFEEHCGCGESDHVLLTTPGIYYAAYTVHMPEGQEVHTDLALHLEGRMLRDSHMHVDHDGSHQEHAMAHAIFEVRGTQRLHLRTRQRLHLSSQRRESAVTLAVFRIG